MTVSRERPPPGDAVPTSRVGRILRLWLPFVVYLVGLLLLGGWIIDDAGISFAYARSAAFGHGFVSQPGRVPVEGFSNFLWVVTLAPLFVLRLFDPIVTPKAVSALLVLGAFAILQRTLSSRTKSESPGLAATLLLALSPPIVIWTSSGLENGLTLILLAWLYREAVERPPRVALRAGAITALLAMTHPDGLIYVLFGPVLSLFVGAEGGARLLRTARRAPSSYGAPSVGTSSPGGGRALSVGTSSPGGGRALSVGTSSPSGGRAPGVGTSSPGGGMARSMAEYGLGFGALFGPFLAFRLSVFGLPLPHTYYAKRSHPSAWDRLEEMARDPGAVVTKLLDLLRGTFGAPGPYVAALIGAVALVLLIRRRLPREAGTALLLGAIGTLGYLYMDADWMGEHRFATGPILFAVLALVTVATAAGPSLSERSSRFGRGGLARSEASTRPGVGILLAGLTITAGGLFFPRIVAFAENPPTPYADVRRSFAAKLDAYADRLGISGGSMLVADVGAPLMESRLTVYDAAGLCEPEVIRTLKEGKHIWLQHHPAFYDWVFERARPTFIATHHFWTLVTALERDPRFARDYVAIDAYEDAYVKRIYGPRLRSGDFVRRDALADFSRLQALREGYTPPPRPDPLAVRLREALFDSPPTPTPEAIEALREEASRALQEDNPNRAATLFGRLLEQRPSDREALFERALALDSAIRPDEARREWTKLLDLPPGSPLGAAARLRLSGRIGIGQGPSR